MVTAVIVFFGLYTIAYSAVCIYTGVTLKSREA